MNLIKSVRSLLHNLNQIRRPSALIITLALTSAVSSLAATKTWDGGGGDGLWNTAANWDNDTLPATTDEVVLDNSSVAGTYTVTLPSGATAVTIKKLTRSEERRVGKECRS